MEIILKKTIDNLGREGDIVKVKDGYARNYLLPKKLGQFVTPATLRQLETEKAAIAERLAKEKQTSDQLSAKLNGLVVTLVRNAGQEGRLFGSVTSADIAEALVAKGVEVDKKRINLSSPIKSIGESKITIKTGYQSTVAILVQVMSEARGDSTGSGDQTIDAETDAAVDIAAV